MQHLSSSFASALEMLDDCATCRLRLHLLSKYSMIMQHLSYFVASALKILNDYAISVICYQPSVSFVCPIYFMPRIHIHYYATSFPPVGAINLGNVRITVMRSQKYVRAVVKVRKAVKMDHKASKRYCSVKRELH